jgi:hypothetical protein
MKFDNGGILQEIVMLFQFFNKEVSVTVTRHKKLHTFLCASPLYVALPVTPVKKQKRVLIAFRLD